MKNLIVFFFILPSFFASAQKIAGFYSGTLYNDTTKMVQQYELALSEYKGKITGYSYVTFVVHDTFYYGIRKVKADIVGDSLVVEDDKMIINNFPQAPAKKVNRIITIPLKGQDSVVVLSGRWRTNKTKNFYSVPGSIALSRSGDSSHSPLIGHLKELSLIPNQYAAATEPAVAQIKVKEKNGRAKPEAQAPPSAPLPYQQRKNNLVQTVEFSSDSLVLAFYDNGVVDGDSISVYLNGKNIVAHARLATTAMKKTISIAGLDEVQLVLEAENLGTIPPNTGLMTIKDGEQLYQVSFTADMQTNAAILLRRKKK